MALLSSCLCCSLLLGSIIGGVLTTIVYTVAFFVSLWWIVEAGAAGVEDEGGGERPPIPVPAYLLCIGYVVIVIMSVWMLHALYKKQEKALLVWVFLMILFCFPEMGMVVFMSLVHWKVTSTYGLADLIFYIFRAVFNLMTVLCVQSQYASWRDETINSQTLKRLEHLHMNNVAKSVGKVGRESSMSYHNPAFVASPEPLPLQTNLPSSPPVLTRSYSTASHYSGYRDGPQVMGTLAPVKMGVPGWDPYMTIPRDSQSEFNAAMFTPGSVGFLPLVSPTNRNEANLYADGTNSIGGGGGGGLSVYHHTPQMMYPGEYPFVNPVTSPQFSTQSLDRRRYMRGARGVVSSSVDALNLRTPVLTHQGVVGYLRPAHESRSSLGAESDDFRRYRDVAL